MGTDGSRHKPDGGPLRHVVSGRYLRLQLLRTGTEKSSTSLRPVGILPVGRVLRFSARLKPGVEVPPHTLLKIPFDLAHWQKVAAEKYPHGLPKPFSSDPTQWLFNGHPKGSDQPLQVAVARLLGYQWPRQTGSSFPDCPALGPDGLEKLADEDGIVCLSATKGEAPAAERLRELLAQPGAKNGMPRCWRSLLAQVGYGGKTLDDWLRNGFFEQHCAAVPPAAVHLAHLGRPPGRLQRVG